MDKRVVDFHDYIMGDVLYGISDINSKKMFGGYGIYHEDAIFGIITDESELFFKVDDSNQANFEKLESRQFIYTGHKTKKPIIMPYWLLPEEILEGDKETLEDWVFTSAEVSRNAKK